MRLRLAIAADIKIGAPLGPQLLSQHVLKTYCPPQCPACHTQCNNTVLENIRCSVLSNVLPTVLLARGISVTDNSLFLTSSSLCSSLSSSIAIEGVGGSKYPPEHIFLEILADLWKY